MAQSNAKLRYEGKVTVVTGGSKGIGEGCVRVFVRNGSKVVFCARGEEAGKALETEINKQGPGEAYFVPCDVTKEEDIKNLIDKAVEKYGRIDCLINNAGWHPPMQFIDEVSAQDLRNLFDLNVVSYFLASKYALPHLRKTQGNIINDSSLVGHIGQVGAVSYVTTKKKEADKLSSEPPTESSGVSQETSQSSSSSLDTNCSNNESLNTQASSVSQEFLSNCSNGSSQVPVQVGGVSSKRGALVLGSDSETDSPVKNASPWLSKQAAINAMTNGHSSPVSSSVSSAQEQSQFKDEQRELYSNLAILQDIYPNTARPKLVEALASADNNVDAAIDWIISNQEEGTGRKRAFQRIQPVSSDEESSPVQPPHKKARALDYSESQEDDLDFESQVKFLAEAFPDSSRDVLIMTLKSKDYSLEKASDALSCSGLFPASRTRPVMNNIKTHQLPRSPKGPPKLQPMVSPTENVGSIKAYQAARLARQTSSPSAKLDGGMDRKTEKHKDRNIFSLYSNNSTNDDEEDGEEAEYSGESESDEESAPSDPIINFLNEATADELVAMDGCSKKKADILLQMRPFEGWTELLEKLAERSRELNFNVISSCKDVLHMRSVVHKLMMKCQKIATNMEYIVSELTGMTSLEESDRTGKYLTQQPNILSDGVKLKPYQMVGVNWLYLMHRQGLDGILGDEMGLGKTIQTIAFLAQLLQDGNKGPHVIIVPSSTIDNWLRELHIWCPTIKVSLYYGSQEERRYVRQQLLEDKEEFHVIVTTYNMASGSVEDRALFKKYQFHYSVFDEGHMLKNMTSMRYQSLMKIKASRRLLLTGTPLQNNLVELMSLLAFVMPDMFCGKTDHIKKIFTTISSRSNYETKGEYERQTISQAKSILKPFFLRRLKREVLQQLPTKSDIIEKVSMAFEQGDLYDNLRNEFNKKLQAEKDGTTVKSSGSAMLMQLRKAANHHLLHRKLYDESKLRTMAKLMVKEPTHREANVDYVYEDMEVMSDFELHKLCLQYKNIQKFALDDEQIVDTGKFRYLDNLLSQLKPQGDRVLLFSQFTMMLDILEDYLNVRGHVFIRLDGQTPVAERQDLIDQFNSDTDIFVFLLSTKAGGLGINLTAANVVVLHDIDFNPYNDKQAEDRCHRVGQTRDVTVYRLVSKNTVEEAMLRCAQAKLQLEQDVTGQTEAADSENTNDVASLLHEALAIETDD